MPLSWRALAGVAAVVAIAVVAALLLSGGGHPAQVGAAKAGVAQLDGKAVAHDGGITGGVHGRGGATHRAANSRGTGSVGGATGTGTVHPGVGAGAKPSTIPSATGGGVAGGRRRLGEGWPSPRCATPKNPRAFPCRRPCTTRSASTPSVAAEAAVAPGAASDAEIRKELGEEEKAKTEEQAAQRRVSTPVAGGFSVGGNGTIPIPTDVPETVQRVIAGGNAIADFPYIWGGGHASFVANGYDCSGSVSYALAAGGLLNAPLVSGDLASWGEPGPGRWITIYANAGHTFMDVDGVWFDTAGRSGPYASRWLVAQPSLEGYAVRHPPGL